MTRQIQDIAKPHLPGCPWVTTSPKTLDFALRTQKEAATYCDKTQSALPNQRAGRAYAERLRRRRQCGYICRARNCFCLTFSMQQGCNNDSNKTKQCALSGSESDVLPLHYSPTDPARVGAIWMALTWGNLTNLTSPEALASGESVVIPHAAKGPGPRPTRWESPRRNKENQCGWTPGSRFQRAPE